MSINSVSTLPTLYEYYTAGGITNGLSVEQPHFTLNDRKITIYSGAMHYFRVPKEYWRDRLRKMRAAGLNAIETYVPWNLHEPEPGVYDFGDGGSDMERFLDLRLFLKTVQEEDLFAIIRPGPYICTEWDFGGLPSWLLREPGIKVRTSDPKFMNHVSRYFNILMPILALFQFTKRGPIIGFQVENEYGSTYQKNVFTPDKVYLEQLRRLMIRNGIEELLFTSDSARSGTVGSLPEYFLMTANFAVNPEQEFDKLKEFQPDKPVMAMEWWTGWFDHWSDEHHVRNDSEFADVFERILKYPASVNMYMFHGGTNFGFMNGANIVGDNTDNDGYQPDTTSYDYDSPLTECGDYTEKYIIVKNLIKKYETVQTLIPQTPSITPKKVYPNIPITQQLILSEILDTIPNKFHSASLISMENLPINNNSGQKYGYIIYRKEHLTIPKHSVLKISGRVCDTVIVLINGILMSKPIKKASDLNLFGTWRVKDSTLNLGPQNFTDATLELVVENWGRNNFGHINQFNQFKGIWQGDVLINDKALSNWQIIPLEFKSAWTKSLTQWHEPEQTWLPGPILYKSTFTTQNPQDTFINMSEWTKGIVIVNNFVLGRYSKMGPQQTLYLPAPFLNNGTNEIIIFEHYIASDKITFSETPIYKTNL